MVNMAHMAHTVKHEIKNYFFETFRLLKVGVILV